MVYGAFSEAFMRDFYGKLAMDDVALRDCAPEICRRLDALLVNAQKDAGSMEAYLERVAELLPEGMTLEEDTITWTEPLDNRNLKCIVQLTPPGEKLRTKWISHKLMVDEPEDDWEW